MTSVPPLSDVHKIGIFGNTENKDESNLLEVSEETSKSIYQILVQLLMLKDKIR